MKLTFTKLAMISAVVLTLAAINPQEAQAQCTQVGAAVTFDAQFPETLNICATIDNTFVTAVTDVNFQTVGATNSAVAQDVGCLIMAADAAGTIDEDNTACNGGTVGLPPMARLVSNDEAGVAGLIALDGAFPDQEVRLQFNVVDRTLVCTDGALAGTTADLVIQRLFTDQTTPATWTYNGTDEATTNADPLANVIGAANTDAAGPTGGDLDIYIGAEIQTDNTANLYESGACNGSFEVTLFY